MEYNLGALFSINNDFEYIVFNDKGDESIYEDIKHLIVDDRIKYVYSDINYGKKMCTGGWVGALEHINSKYIHNFSQDDVATADFYKKCIDKLESDDNIFLCHTNMIHTDESLNATGFQLDPNTQIDFSNSLSIFRQCFGIDSNNNFSRNDNCVAAPAAIYRSALHDLIGIPDLEFAGAMDYEYWMRILFNNYTMYYINEPLIYYRHSKYTAGNEIIDGKINRGYWQQESIKKIKNKYQNLWNEKNNK